MKTLMILAAALFAAPVIFAQDEAPARPARQLPEAMKKYDKDGDGKLSAEESRTMMQERRAEREKEQLKKYDKDGDGKLSEEERQAMNADRRANRPARPANVEGRGPRADSAMAEGFRRGPRTDSARNFGERGERGARGERPNMPNREEMMKKYDKDGDGKLNDEEREAMRKELRAQFGANTDSARVRGEGRGARGERGVRGGEGRGARPEGAGAGAREGGRRGNRGEGAQEGGRRGNRGEGRGARGEGLTPPPPPPASAE